MQSAKLYTPGVRVISKRAFRGSLSDNHVHVLVVFMRIPCDGLLTLPRVYVYDASLGFVAHNPFGFAIDDNGTTAASGPTFVNAVHARLAASSTKQPEDADLFFIPESAADDADRCGSLERRLDSYWQSSRVNYFRRHAGADHFTASHFRASLLTCSAWHTAAFREVTKLVGVIQSPWFVEGRPLPISPQRLRLRPFACATWMDVCPWLPNETRAATEAAAERQHVLEVPYGGSVHGAAAWRSERQRPLLAVAAFNSRGHRNFHRQMELRRALLSQCSTSPATCRTVSFNGRYTLANTDDPQGHAMLRATLDGYRKSTFSLQPAGDDPARKGLIDSVTCGCVPVVFQEQQQQLWPHHWAAWVREATVRLPMDAVLNGTLDVLAALRAIPQRRIARMQQVLRANAHRLHYALVGARDAAGDALEITLAHLGARRRVQGIQEAPARCDSRQHGPKAHGKTGKGKGAVT